MSAWYLEGYFMADDMMRRQPLHSTSLTIGRSDGVDVTIKANAISRAHARITVDGDVVTIEDLGSRNGTFINRRKVTGPEPVRHGDIIHLGDVEMRLMQDGTATQEEDFEGGNTMMMIADDFQSRIPYGAGELEEVIEKQLVTAAFQPIVEPDGRTRLGYEILGRGTTDLIGRSPGALFQVAESVGREVALSELMRNRGVETAERLGLQGRLFINTHPSELRDLDALLRSIQQLHKRCPHSQLLLEIHENSITDIAAIRFLKAELAKMSISIAYDDFGVGQSRLLELVEATPDIVKFDIALTQDIHLAGPAKVDLVQQLHELARRLEVKTLAECVSKHEEYEVCKTVGFDLYQGYLFGRPEVISESQSRAA